MTENQEVVTVSPEMPKQTPYERAQAIYNGIRKLKGKIVDLDLIRECGEIEYMSKLLVEDLAPMVPRTLDDAYAWGMRGAKENTYLALLDEEGILLRTLRVSDTVLKRIDGRMEEKTIETELTQVEIVIGNMRKPVPRKASKFVAFTVEGSGTKRVHKDIPTVVKGLPVEEEAEEEPEE